MSEYYSRKLSATRLKQVYEVAFPRITQYLDAELDHVLENIRPATALRPSQRKRAHCRSRRIKPVLRDKAARQHVSSQGYLAAFPVCLFEYPLLSSLKDTE